MNLEFLQGPFPARKASMVLYERLTSFLANGQASVGDMFLSDASVVQMSGLSRATARRALDRLAREGWIERRAGVGSFVGPRMAMVNRKSAHPAVEVSSPRSVIRVAVLIHMSGENALPDWYSRGVMEGLDQAALEHGIQVELIGNYTSDIRVLSRRLEQSRPDLLVVMPASSRHVMLAGLAGGLGIPCLFAGSQSTDTGLPTIGDDGVQGAVLAVRHLAAHGHRRIGLLMSKAAATWAHARRDGFMQGLRECGLEADERMVLWTPYAPAEGLDSKHPETQYPALLNDYLKRVQPTALILGCAGQHACTVGLAMKAGQFRVPDDVSLVCFDQNYAEYYQHLGMRPTVVALPLRETGVQLAVMARRIVDKQSVASAPVYLPCRLEEGESVARPVGKTDVSTLAGKARRGGTRKQ